MNIRKFFKNVIGTLGTEFLLRLLGFIATVIIVRNISAGDFGVFSLLITFSITLVYLTNLGFHQSIVYFLGKNRIEIDKIISLAVIFSFCIVIATIAVIYVLRDYHQGSFLKDLPRRYFIPLFIMYGLGFLDSILLSVVRGLNNFFIFNFKRLLTQMGYICGLIIIYLVLGLKLELIVSLYILVNMVATLWFLYRTGRMISFKFKFDKSIFKPVFFYGIKSYLQIVAGHLIYYIDVYIIAYFLELEAVAFYVVAVGIATLLWLIPNTLGVVLFPALSATDDQNNIHLLTALICRHTIFVTGSAAIVLSLLGKPMIQILYGSTYNASFLAMLLILPGILMMSVYKVIVRNFSSRNRQQVSVFAAVIALSLNILLNFYLIPKYGIEGAAVASTISYGVASTILIAKLKIESGIALHNMLLINNRDLNDYKKVINLIAAKMNISS